MANIDIYNYLSWGDYNKRIDDLAKIALPEQWNFSGKTDNAILKNYLKYTFDKLQEENKVVETEEYCLFNTGLFDKYYESIYVYGEKHMAKKDKWKFVAFCTKYSLGNMGIGFYPDRADYFQNPDLLVFDWRCEVNVQYQHILEDAENKRRLPESVLNAERPDYLLRGAIDNAIKRAMANYKLAVPQYFNNQIQLLLPLCFGVDDKPDLVLVLTKMSAGFYQGHTCLTMEMAYNNARLISKPESNWLLPQ